MRRFYGSYGPLASFVCVSMAQAAGVPELPGTVVRNAVDTASVPFRPVPARPPYLPFLGRISSEKGIGEVIWLAREAGLPLKIAGVVQERDREYFESGWCRTCGRVTPNSSARCGTPRSMSCSATPLALVLLPNYEDPCPVVALEALAAGTPVLALARGGLPELVADGVTGLIAGDLPGLLRKLPGLAGISRDTCRAVAAAQFGADRLTRDYVAVYRGTSQPSRASDR